MQSFIGMQILINILVKKNKGVEQPLKVNDGSICIKGADKSVSFIEIYGYIPHWNASLQMSWG